MFLVQVAEQGTAVYRTVVNTDTYNDALFVFKFISHQRNAVHTGRKIRLIRGSETQFVSLRVFDPEL